MPTFGITSTVGFDNTVVNYQHNKGRRAPYVWTPGAGNMVTAHIFARVLVNAGVNQLCLHVYTWNANPALCNLVATSGIINVTSLVSIWHSVAIAGALLPATAYSIDIQGYNSVNFRLRPRTPILAWGDSWHLADGNFIAPATFAGAAINTQLYSGYVTYTVGGADPDPEPTWAHEIIYPNLTI